MRDGEILTPGEVDRLTRLTQAIAVSIDGLRLTDVERQLAEAQTERAELERLLAALARPS
jgi:hypothetical protein